MRINQQNKIEVVSPILETHTTDRSDQFQAWVLEPDFAHIYLPIAEGTLRVCIHRNPEDKLFHCTCGHTFKTVDAAQLHGRNNQDKDHPKGFFDLFFGKSNSK